MLVISPCVLLDVRPKKWRKNCPLAKNTPCLLIKKYRNPRTPAWPTSVALKIKSPASAGRTPRSQLEVSGKLIELKGEGEFLPLLMTPEAKPPKIAAAR